MKLLPQQRSVVGVQDAKSAFNLTRLGPIVSDLRLSALLRYEERERAPPSPGFETIDEMRIETGKRIRSLRNYATICDRIPRASDAAAARALADAMTASTPTSSLPNLAIPYFMRRVRNGYGSHLIAAIHRLAPGTPVHVCTVIVASWARTPSQLTCTQRDDLLSTLRARLNEAGLSQLSGWCVLGLHGEFRRASGFELHFHGVVVGDKWLAFQALRDLPMFKGGNSKPIRVPVRIAALENPARQLSYLLQGFWPTKYRGEEPGTDEGLRRRRRRIPEPHHAQHLLWLSRQRLSDLMWLHGIAIRNGRLEPV